MPVIDELRAQIDALDEQILSAASQRFAVCAQIAAEKRRQGLAVVQEDRGAAVSARFIDRARSLGVSKNFAAALIDLVMTECVRIQEDIVRS